jgi:peptidyl-prolyl cis-trans isomerase SurA
MNPLFIIIAVPFIFMSHEPSSPTKLMDSKSEVRAKDAKKLAEYYRQRVIKGESMASICTLYSEDPGSAPNGGQYRDVKKGIMVPEFEKVAFSLKPNEISEVFETQYGFHFIQLISRKGDILDLRHLLITKN